MDDCTALSIMPPAPLPALNQQFERLDAPARAAWALTYLPGTHVLSSSFGAQAAVSLHLLTRLMPNIPVILIDTGYLFPETYRFVDRLTERFKLNLRVYRAARSPAWQEARYGKLWEQGTAGLRRYNRINKVEPMRRALADLDAGTWFSGLRRVQAASRRATRFVEYRNGRYKVHPIADWSNRDVWVYLKRHRLPYHPLWEQGYVSIGDVHTTRPLEQGMREEETRFFGLQRECGLHSEL
ncbi:MAG TPA: phosphoadenylyl-sulfate reductase [Gammaproteobacteria bacterium]|nr:phosphoadenylyl-sulfate reductase [Gammaproteobacteria bacterium]